MFTTFVINLDQDVERMQFMHTQLMGLNIPYRRESAVLGKQYKPTSDEYDESLALVKGGHALLPGEIGCALSHARIINKIVNEKIPFALVLEDDVELSPVLKKIIEKEINKNNTWEYLLFDYAIVGIPFIRQWIIGVLINIKKTWEKKPEKAPLQAGIFLLKALYIFPLSLFEGLRNIYKEKSPGPALFLRPVYFAGAYLVTYSGAVKLQALCNPVVYTADHLPNKARILLNLRFRGYSPQVVFQNKKLFGSSILEIKGDEI